MMNTLYYVLCSLFLAVLVYASFRTDRMLDDREDAACSARWGGMAERIGLDCVVALPNGIIAPEAKVTVTYACDGARPQARRQP